MIRNAGISLFLILVAFACRNTGEVRDMNAYFENEIRNRQEVLRKLDTANSSGINTAAIHEEVNACILLSKDIENLSASVDRGNAYFLNMANSYSISYGDFTKLTTGMHVDEIALVLKQNELNLLNQLIFKLDPGQNQIYTAQ